MKREYPSPFVVRPGRYRSSFPLTFLHRATKQPSNLYSYLFVLGKCDTTHGRIRMVETGSRRVADGGKGGEEQQVSR